MICPDRDVGDVVAGVVVDVAAAADVAADVVGEADVVDDVEVGDAERAGLPACGPGCLYPGGIEAIAHGQAR